MVFGEHEGMCRHALRRKRSFDRTLESRVSFSCIFLQGMSRRREGLDDFVCCSSPPPKPDSPRLARLPPGHQNLLRVRSIFLQALEDCRISEVVDAQRYGIVVRPLLQPLCHRPHHRPLPLTVPRNQHPLRVGDAHPEGLVQLFPHQPTCHPLALDFDGPWELAADEPDVLDGVDEEAVARVPHELLALCVFALLAQVELDGCPASSHVSVHCVWFDVA